ncbi:ExeA family protein [Clostridium oryzae]|uniref:ORC1/DEAH AAA+ ATPase domain-containing protein n=1 Tax=Clostridium oryzae TaxID=1450648 RepID=A0A1V4I3S4_9CLOT|nr:AAA family ATPase [Clostridium oryzae]OPJ54549.1 hypothetical protein CLORY_45660 [Clostridium oryzae]
MNNINSSLCQHFKLNCVPFLERSKTSFEYKQFNDNLELLSSAFMTRQIVCITGASGTGKSSLIFYAVNQLEPSQFRIAGIELSNPNKKALYKTLAIKVGLKPAYNADDIKLQLINFFDEENAQGKFNTVIIDEAHTLSISLFDELRSFYDEGLNFSLVFSGLPPLKNQLNLAVNQPLKQRIFVFLDCCALSLSETKEYILSQLNVVGAKVPVFDEQCFPFLHSVTSGVPRRINQLCYGGLLAALKRRETIVSEYILRNVHENLNYQV